MKSARYLVDSLDTSVPQRARGVAPIDAPDQISSASTKSKRRKKRACVIVGGVKYPLHQDPRSKVWRVRKRTKDVSVDLSLGVVRLDDAEARAKELLGREHAQRKRLRSGGVTLREICDAYLAMPKRCSEDVARDNVKRMAKIVGVAWGESLESVRGSQLDGSLWEDYARARQGGKLDLSTRRHENRGINSAMRMAVSLFHKGLEMGYARAGIVLDFEEIRRVAWLPVIPSKLPVLTKDAQGALMGALPGLKEKDPAMWRAIMIARFAGLRAGEISAATKSWLVRNTAGALCFEVRDRPEEEWWHKTGEDYMAPVLSLELEADLLACPESGPLVPVEGSREHFFKRRCNEWLRQFIPRPNKGLHRLRALYAEALRDATANAVLAQQAGLEAARAALGHTTTATTSHHYLPAPCP